MELLVVRHKNDCIVGIGGGGDEIVIVLSGCVVDVGVDDAVDREANAVMCNGIEEGLVGQQVEKWGGGHALQDAPLKWDRGSG